MSRAKLAAICLSLTLAILGSCAKQYYPPVGGTVVPRSFRVDHSRAQWMSHKAPGTEESGIDGDLRLLTFDKTTESVDEVTLFTLPAGMAGSLMAAVVPHEGGFLAAIQPERSGPKLAPSLHIAFHGGSEPTNLESSLYIVDDTRTTTPWALVQYGDGAYLFVARGGTITMYPASPAGLGEALRIFDSSDQVYNLTAFVGSKGELDLLFRSSGQTTLSRMHLLSLDGDLRTRRDIVWEAGHWPPGDPRSDVVLGARRFGDGPVLKRHNEDIIIAWPRVLFPQSPLSVARLEPVVSRIGVTGEIETTTLAGEVRNMALIASDLLIVGDDIWTAWLQVQGSASPRVRVDVIEAAETITWRYGLAGPRVLFEPTFLDGDAMFALQVDPEAVEHRPFVATTGQTFGDRLLIPWWGSVAESLSAWLGTIIIGIILAFFRLLIAAPIFLPGFFVVAYIHRHRPEIPRRSPQLLFLCVWAGTTLLSFAYPFLPGAAKTVSAVGAGTLSALVLILHDRFFRRPRVEAPSRLITRVAVAIMAHILVATIPGLLKELAMIGILPSLTI